MVSARVCFDEKERLHFIPEKTKVNAKPCCRNLFKNADLFCHVASSFNRTARLHTWQSWLKTGLLPTAVNSLVKMNGLRTRLTCHVWGAMLERYKSFQPKPENINELKKVLQLIWDQLP